MSIILATILAISATPSGAAQETAMPTAQSMTVKSAAVQTAAPAAPRSGRELLEAAHATMRHWAKATDQDADTAARELLGIYREIQQDTRMARSQRETLRLTVRARLDQLCTQIAKRVAKDKAVAQSKVTLPGSAVKSVAADEKKQASAILAGVGAPAGGGAGGGAAAGQNANSDNGQALVDLIQNVICPKSWDVNGGSCSIYYWQQQHAIVVRATGEVHGEISETLEQLNRANH
jgi:hypothetical protein